MPTTKQLRGKKKKKNHIQILTKREKASLNSETCSSVKVSAWSRIGVCQFEKSYNFFFPPRLLHCLGDPSADRGVAHREQAAGKGMQAMRDDGLSGRTMVAVGFVLLRKTEV